LRRLRSTSGNDKDILSSLSNLSIRLYAENASCLICCNKTNLLKTDRKTCYSFALGKFTLISGCTFCADHKYFSETPNQIIRYESNLAAMIVDKGYRVTFDLVVKVGRLRYDDHRQLQEIQAYLKCSSAKIDLPLSTIGMIAKRFLDFCRLLHQSREPKIREEIGANGGYFLHFDGSTEQRCGLCSLVLMDSRSGHILESLMVPSEKYDTIEAALDKVRAKYGNPLAIISDLRSGFLRACITVFGQGVIHILCHYHYLRTFKDAFVQDHTFINTCMTKKWRLQAGLAKQLKSLQEIKPKVGYPKELKTVGEIEDYLERTGDVLGTYKYVLRWILNFKSDSSGKGVPFDLPYLDLYYRFVTGKRVIDRIFAQSSIPLRLKYYRHGFCRVAEKTKKLGNGEPGFNKALRQLEYAYKWFNKLRAVLFLEAQMEDDKLLAPLSKKYRLTEHEAQEIPKRLNGFLCSVKRELSTCKHKARRAFLESLQSQVERYQDNLCVPMIAVTVKEEESRLVPPRTNNCLESLFRFVKSLLRRCSGRSKLPKEFGSVGSLVPYYITMRDHPNFRDLFMDDSRLAEEFAKLFAEHWQPPDNLATLPKKSTNDADNTPLVALEA
jgi:hypothetical protein